MATRTTITIEHPETPLELRLTDKSQVVEAVVSHLEGFASGALRFGAASVTVEQGGTKASGAITLDGANGEILVTIAGQEVEADGSNYSSDAETAFFLAGFINEGPLSAVVTAEAVGAAVVIAARVVGAAGNLVTLSVLGTGVSASGATLAGGTDPTGRTLDF